MKVLILGSTSGLALSLLRFQDEIRRSQTEPVFPKNQIRLGEQIPTEDLEDVDCVMNFCLSFTRNFGRDLQENMMGALTWANQTGSYDKKMFVQISSDAIRFNPQSFYSRIKSSVDTEISKIARSKVLRIPTLIGEETPNPSRKMFRILSLEEKFLKSIYVPEGFVKEKNLKFLKVSDFWSLFRTSLEGTSKIDTLVSHNTKDLFSLVEIWQKHQEIIGPNYCDQSAYKAFDIKFALNLYDKCLKLGLPYVRTAESLRAFI